MARSGSAQECQSSIHPHPRSLSISCNVRQMQAALIADDAASINESSAGHAWETLLKRTRPELERLKVVDWIQNKCGRTLVLGQEHLVYCRSNSSTRSTVRWILKLEHISSIITVGYTVVVSYSDSVRLGRIHLDVPAWHTVACKQEAVVEVIMQKVNKQLDHYFEKRYVKDSSAVQGTGIGGQARSYLRNCTVLLRRPIVAQIQPQIVSWQPECSRDGMNYMCRQYPH